MKNMVLLGILASLAQAGPALAEVPASQLLGSWSLDVLHSQIPAEARPKSVTITYTEESGGKWRSNVDIIGGDGSKISAAGTYPLDGTSAPSEGYLNVDTVAAKMPAPNVWSWPFTKKACRARPGPNCRSRWQDDDRNHRLAEHHGSPRSRQIIQSRQIVWPIRRCLVIGRMSASVTSALGGKRTLLGLSEFAARRTLRLSAGLSAIR